MQFPQCDDENAISVSCLDLYYSVTLYKENKALKDEKDDKTAPLVLHNLEEDDTDSSGLSHRIIIIYTHPWSLILTTELLS